VPTSPDNCFSGEHSPPGSFPPLGF
jgi:hypothetical protein